MVAAIAPRPRSGGRVIDREQAVRHLGHEGRHQVAGPGLEDAVEEWLDHQRRVDVAGFQNVAALRQRHLHEIDLLVVHAMLGQPAAKQHLHEGADARHADAFALEVLRRPDGHPGARDHAAAIPGVHVVHGSAGDHDHVKAASGRLQKDGRRGAADLNAAADQGGGDGGIQRDQHQLDVESVSGKQALIPGDEQSREADGVGIADAELRGGLRRDADTGQCHHAGPSPGRENTSHGSPPCLSNGTMPIINFFVNNIDKSN